MAAVQPRSVRSFRAKPTEARPKHSLFGTALEKIPKSELEGIDASEADKIGVKEQTPRYPIPEHLQGHVSARAMVDKARQDISCQNKAVVDAQKQLKAKEQKALMFRPDSERSERGRSREKGWFSKQDLEHSKDMNAVGLSKSGSYNHEKYGNKPPTHNYSLVGDVLTKGNEFGHPQRYELDEALAALNTSENSNLGAIRLGWNPKVDPDKEMPLKPKPKDGVQLPPNIRHRYGSRVCDSLLSDPKKVSESMEKVKAGERSAMAPAGVDIEDYLAKAASGNYFEVGHMTRYNIFPGHSMLDMNSNMRAQHSDVVYMRREPMPNEYRIIKDSYVVWREQFLLRKRMEEQWDSFLRSQPKFSASWDRSQTRPVREPQKPQALPPKPKSKPKPKPKAKPAEKEPLFEDVVFTTPPITPPPKPPSPPVKIPKNVERDEEFWKLYDGK